jgi:hypothetical protein
MLRGVGMRIGRWCLRRRGGGVENGGGGVVIGAKGGLWVHCTYVFR